MSRNNVSEYQKHPREVANFCTHKQQNKQIETIVEEYASDVNRTVTDLKSTPPAVP